MTLKIIEGGSTKSPKEKKKELVNQAEQLKMFVSHMRAIETSISSVKTMAVQMNWDELNLKLISCHKHILDTLVFVKNSSKSKKLESKTIDKPNTHLKLL